MPPLRHLEHVAAGQPVAQRGAAAAREVGGERVERLLRGTAETGDLTLGDGVIRPSQVGTPTGLPGPSPPRTGGARGPSPRRGASAAGSWPGPPGRAAPRR